MLHTRHRSALSIVTGRSQNVVPKCIKQCIVQCIVQRIVQHIHIVQRLVRCITSQVCSKWCSSVVKIFSKSCPSVLHLCYHVAARCVVCCNTQCALCTVRKPCIQKLKYKNHFPMGNNFYGLFVPWSFRMKTLKLVSLFIFRL